MMSQPAISWRSERRTESKGDVLVVMFDLGVEIRIAGEFALRTVHWETTPTLDADAQRAEVARAIDWGRLHDTELRGRFKDRRGALRLSEDVRRLASDARGRAVSSLARRNPGVHARQDEEGEERRGDETA